MHHQLEKHYINRAGWLRAAVLGANDGLLSTTSIVIGIAAAEPERHIIILAALAGMIAGAMSMAAGEYVSVSSQEDTEKADLIREQRELEEMPEIELRELAKVYEERGCTKETAMQVAIELTKHDALGAHARDELGINEITQARPLQAAMASFSSFAVGALLPFTVSLWLPLSKWYTSIWVCDRIFDAFRGNFCQSRRFRYKNSCIENLFLGNRCHGNYSTGRTCLRS